MHSAHPPIVPEQRYNPRVGRILLLGYFGADNFGDDALLADWLLKHEQWLQERGLVCDVLSRSPEPLRNFSEAARLAPLIDRCLGNKEALKLNPRDYSALIAPGGSLLQDTTSLRSLLFYLWLIYRFQRARRPVFMLNQGLGPLDSITARLATAFILRRATLVSLRDAASYDWLRTNPLLARQPEVHSSADPILSAQFCAIVPDWLASRQPYALVIPKPTGDLPYRGDSTTEAEALAQVCEALSARCGLKTLILPLHPSQDQALCESITGLAHHAELASTAVPVANNIWGLIQGAALVVSYRLHGLVSAVACGVPAYGIAYDPKVSAFCDMAGLPWCFPAQIHLPVTLDDIAEYYGDLPHAQESLGEHRAAMLALSDKSEQRFRDLWGEAVDARQ